MARQVLVYLGVVLGTTLCLSMVVTFLTRAAAWRIGFVARPRAERWHARPTALAGGVGIFVAFAASTAFVGGDDRARLLIGGGAMFGLGLVDDVFHLKPYAKLLGQFIIAALTVASGATLPWTPVALLNQAISVFWLIGITNAINLLDNMDGLAAGVALISVLFQAIFFLLLHQYTQAAVAAALGGALAGFLIFNWSPASIFMGDCGALFLGYILALLAMQSSYGRSRGLLATIAAPVLIMLVPIFDTTFVTITRIVRGRSVSQGGRDHTSHRLVTLGLSDRTAVVVLLSLGLLGGTIAVLARIGVTAGVWVGVPLIGLMLAFVGVHLARTDEPAIPGKQGTFLLSVAAFAHKRRVFEVLVDAVLAMVSLVAAFLLRFDGAIPSDIAHDLSRVFLVVVAAKLVALYVTHAYDGVWRHAGLHDLGRLLRAALLGSAAVFCIVGIWLRFGSLSRGALVMDALIFAVFICAARVSFRLLRVVLSGVQEAPKTGLLVLLWGAGDLGAQLAMQLLDNPDQGLVPVGFVDDDPLKLGRLVHGLPVRGQADAIPDLLDAGVAAVVLVTSSKVSPDSIARMVARVGSERLRRIRMVLEPVEGALRPELPAAFEARV